ncbi:MAG: coproporphyrinogen dehydrogenase HemZ [Clostridiales bacterium]|jgi:oxygen-independent coproporphyrinogen-3 oxidase|nr:coproporphyrinogen dehydrogenase HemZ [Clostridiales bacterium]
MKLYLDGHGFIYPAQQIAICVFPDERHETVEKKPDDGDYAVISLVHEGDNIYSECELSRNGEVYFGKSPTENRGENPLEYARHAGRAVRTAFYKAAVEFLGKNPPWGAVTGIRPAKIPLKLFEKGLSERETDGVLENEYFVSAKKRALLIDVARCGLRFEAEREPNDFSLYIGIPFCATRCEYCSFVSHSIEKAGHLIGPYLDMLKYELSMYSKIISKLSMRLKSIYIGGGTPTVLQNKQLDDLMGFVSESFDFSDIVEYTVEAGRPDTADIEKILTIKNRGATRISINPQTMDDGILAAQGRNHTSADIIRMTENVRETGGLAVNMDLIAGLPGDTVLGFKRSINKVLDLNPENITVHTLSIKKGSNLKATGAPLPNGEDVSEMVDYAAERITNAGYKPYYLYRQKYISGNLENTGYAMPGHVSAYNIYIMNELHTIISAGAGGVTKLVSRDKSRIERLFNSKYPYEYNNSRDKLIGHFEKTEEFLRSFL